MIIQFDHLNPTDRLVVTTNTNKTLKQIEDRAVLANVLAALKNYQAEWGVPEAGVPVANLRFNFYQGDTLLGNVGVGRKFLTALFRGSFFSRSFEAEGYAALMKLVDLELKLK
jgi:hypothetical protein